MRPRKPLTNKDGEVRELLLEDMKRFRPTAEVLPQVAPREAQHPLDKGAGWPPDAAPSPPPGAERAGVRWGITGASADMPTSPSHR